MAAANELLFERIYDAPPSVVYEAFTDPKHLVNWWGPHGFTTTIQEMDVRPGGVWRLVMRGPDGRNYRNHIVFQEVEPSTRLVFEHQPEPGSEPGTHQTIVTFTELEARRTRVEMRLVFASEKARDHVVKTFKADEGGKQTLERLSMHLVAVARMNKHLVLKRTFAAPREVVFKAWTDPKQLARWWGPKGFTNPVCEIDVRPGGKFLIEMHSPEGRRGFFCGEYSEVDEPRRIVYYSKTPEGEVLSRHCVHFAASGTRQTELAIEVEVIRFTDATPGILAGMKEGFWQSCDRLAAELVEPVVLTRMFDAPRELVWKMWVDGKHVARWWGPNGTSNEMQEWDARAGGRIAFQSWLRDGTALPITGEFVEVSHMERISLITRSPDEADGVRAEMITTVTLEEGPGGKTRLTLESRIIGTTDPGLFNLANVGSGWSEGLGRMAEELEAAK